MNSRRFFSPDPAKRCGSGLSTSVSGVKARRSPCSEWEILDPQQQCSGSGSLDPYTGLRMRIRILLCSLVAFKMLKKISFLLILTLDKFTSVCKDNKSLKSKKNSWNQGFYNKKIFLLMLGFWFGSGPDPDPVPDINYGSDPDLECPKLTDLDSDHCSTRKKLWF